MARRPKRVRERRRSLRKRFAGFVRELFGGGGSLSADDPRWDDPVGGVGVREPRNPRRPTLSGAVALEPPPDDRRDVWAVGSD